MRTRYHINLMSKTMNRYLINFCILVITLQVAKAQQDPLFTQFMNNKLIYNPGYAGTPGGYCGALQYRKQWAGFEGAPTTFALAADASLMKAAKLPLGIGVTIMQDKIGPISSLFFRAAGSYNLKLGIGTLGMGLDLGIVQKSIANNNWVVPEPLKNDPSIPSGMYSSYQDPKGNGDFSQSGLDVGAGVYFNAPGKFYVGLSSTHLPASTLKESDNEKLQFQINRHYYAMAGAYIPVGVWFNINPNIMYRTDMVTPSLDANLSLIAFNMLWLGYTVRNSTENSILFGYQGSAMSGNSLTYKICYSYDLTPSLLPSSGSHEIILSAAFIEKPKKATRKKNARFL